MERSEYTAWHTVANLTRRLSAMLRDVVNGEADPLRIENARDAVANLNTLAYDMLAQLDRGIHRNPPLVLFTNPPRTVGRPQRVQVMGCLSHDIHSVAYTHCEDGQSYKHDFEQPTDLLAAETEDGKRVLVIRNPHGLAVWGDYD